MSPRTDASMIRRLCVIAAALAILALTPHFAGAADVEGDVFPCAMAFSATSGPSSTGSATTLHLTGPRALSGTARMFGRERSWTAAITPAMSVTTTPYGEEQHAVLVRTAAPVVGVQFTPNGETCSLVAEVRPHGPYDREDPDADRAVDGTDAGPAPSTPCTKPYASPLVVRAKEPETPPLAQQQHITGTVIIAVALDENGRVTGARVSSSPSVVLNASALDAAQQSTFRTAVLACRSIPAAYAFVVSYSSR